MGRPTAVIQQLSCIDTLTVYTEKVHDCMFRSGVGLISLNVVHMIGANRSFTVCIAMHLHVTGSFLIHAYKNEPSRSSEFKGVFAYVHRLFSIAKFLSTMN